MALVQVVKSAGSRLEVGDRILAAAKTLDTSLVARHFARFQSAHAALHAHERDAREAEQALRAAQGAVAAADVVLDRAVEAVASALVGAGAPRSKPFAAIGEPKSPSAIRKLKQAEQAKLCLALGKRLEKHEDAAVKRTGKALRLAATAALDAQKPIRTVSAAFSEAIVIRLGPEQEWENAFAALKDAAKAARHDDGGRLFETLFRRTAKKPTKKTTKKPAKTPPSDAPS